MQLMRILALALVMAATVGQPQAATFTVLTTIDDSQAFDANPGDGICSDLGGLCTLRAAIEESNANPGRDNIRFNPDFVNASLNVSSSAGPLPIITDQISISGVSILAHDGFADDIRDTTPHFFINGSLLSSGHGLDFSGASAAGSEVAAIGVINFPSHGILARPGASGLLIHRNFIGVTADGTAAGNGRVTGGIGFYASESGNHIIGQGVSGGSFNALGNVISSNTSDGVVLGSSHGNLVLGNYIGLAPNGSSRRPNSRFGILLLQSDSNSIGGFTATEVAPNYVAANGLGGIQVFGSNNEVVSNILGEGPSGGFTEVNPADGIRVSGDENQIGRSGLGGNKILEFAGAGIVVGHSAVPSDGNSIAGNQIGRDGSLFPLLEAGCEIGIEVFGNTNTIADNLVVNSEFDGIYVEGASNTLVGNYSGFVPSQTLGPLPNGNGQAGIRIVGSANTIGGVPANPNRVGDNHGVGISVTGGGNEVSDNLVGVDTNYENVGNQLAGILSVGNSEMHGNVVGFNGEAGIQIANAVGGGVFGGHIGIAPDGTPIPNANYGVILFDVVDISLAFNNIAYNGAAGIAPVLPGSASSVSWFGNSMFGNGGIAIDMDVLGQNPNDPGDGDTGHNNLQNYPEIISATLNEAVSPPELEITYLVDSDSNNAMYPLTIDFYWTDRDEPMQGRFQLGTESDYSTPGQMATIIFNLPTGTTYGLLAATATDFDFNASEMSPPIPFGTPEVIFMDSLESN